MQIFRFSSKGMDVTLKKKNRAIESHPRLWKVPGKKMVLYCFPLSTAGAVQEISSRSQGELLVSGVRIDPIFLRVAV